MVTYLSPAKINLFLRILKRRPDGYHELASLFQTVNLCDILHVTLSDRDQLTCTDPAIPLDETNLVLKAVNLFRSKTKLSINAAIHLEKQIPIQAGLGGGSSNAATTLWALNEVCGRPATLEQLMEWSSEIGSDITFFLSQGTAYCTGRGEIIQSLPSLKKKSLSIFKPKQGLSTPAIYGKLDVTALEQRDPAVALKSFLEDRPVYFNDLEIPAFAVMPELAKLKADLLSSGFSDVLMSGSGSAFFCLGEGNISTNDDVRCFPVSFINRLPGSWYANTHSI